MGLLEVVALMGLGAFHGLNPGMGWLFSVAIGLQERRRAAVLFALGPIALGHLASIAVVSVAVTVGASALTSRVVAVGGGVLLVGLGMWRLLSKRHFRWVGMRLTPWQLCGWSFLMASVHGAGLMLVPVLTSDGAVSSHAGHASALLGSAASGRGVLGPVLSGLLAAGIHTAATVAVAGVIAFAVYEFLGLAILRTAWVNLDGIWAVALVAAGSVTLVVAVV